jgi:hypothetical protein
MYKFWFRLGLKYEQILVIIDYFEEMLINCG